MARAVIDTAHRGPLVNLAAWITLVCMVVFVFAKISTKWAMVRMLQRDDAIVIVAMFLAIGQCTAVSLQVQYGLGQPEKSLDSRHFDSYEKSAYASQILYTITIYVAKLASLQFLLKLARPTSSELPDFRRASLKGAMAFVFTWIILASFCLAFQCGVPHPWNQASGHCMNKMAFWVANGVVDIATQLAVGFAPVYLLYHLNLQTAKKRIAFLSFMPNITTIPLIVLRLVYLHKLYQSTDTTTASFNVELVTAIHTNLCIIACCTPFLKPVMDSLSVGLINNDIPLPGRSAEESQQSTSKERFNPFAILSGRQEFVPKRNSGWTKFPTSDYTSAVTAGKDSGIEFRNLGSQNPPDRMVIQQTKTIVQTSDSIPPTQPHWHTPSNETQIWK